MYNITASEIHIMSLPELKTISNREDLKYKIHDIHNFLRNNGAGYGMNALKVFNILYGLKRLGDKNLYEEVGITDSKIHFSNLLELAKNEEDEELVELIDKNLLDAIHNSTIKDLLMYEIPKQIKGSVFCTLIKEIDTITRIENDCNVLLSGKIYEYFIGRDESAISELGAYFTDRHIVDYIYSKLDIQLEEDGSIGTMIDPYGGSGGFTTGFIQYIKNRYVDVDWETQLNNIYHFDMNQDVIKSAGLEFFLLTGILPNMTDNVGYKNSFKDDFLDKKFKYVITNPPYGGDKNKKSAKVNKRDKIKKYIESLTETKEKYENQLMNIKREEKQEKKEKDNDKVLVSNSSKRIIQFAKKYKLTGNDKESVSLIQMMDMVEEGGVGCGVLKEGVFFNKTYKHIRRVLIEHYDVESVISVPSSEFENTSTKTSILIFRNNGSPTRKVRFYDLDIVRYEEDKFEEHGGNIVLTESEGDIKEVGDVLVSEATREQILANDIYSLNGKDYNRREIIPGKGYEVVRLGDVCEFKPKSTKTYTGEFNLVKIKDIDNGTIINTDTIKNELVKETNICQYNDIILSNVRPKSRKSCLLRPSVIKNIEKFCFTMPTLRPKNGYHPVYIYSILYPLLNTFEKTICTGSQYPTFKIEHLKDIQIPIPTDPQHLNQWVHKISTPFDECHAKSTRIKQLEEEVADRIRYITENEECDVVRLGDVCNYLRMKHRFASFGKESGLYPFYSSSQKIKTCDEADYNTEAIVIGTGGNSCLHYVNGEFSSSGDTIILQSNSLNNKYIYMILKSNWNRILASMNGSTIKHINKKFLDDFKIPIPKDKTLISNLNPTFTDIERLQNEVKQADILYHQYIEELAKESIVGEHIESTPINTPDVIHTLETVNTPDVINTLESVNPTDTLDIIHTLEKKSKKKIVFKSKNRMNVEISE